MSHYAVDNWGNSDKLLHIENINGSKFNDQIIGDDNINCFSGFDGNDRLDGADNNDFIYGGAGADYIIGGAGDDLLQGDEGDDYIDGGAGADWLSYGSKTSNNSSSRGALVNLRTGTSTDNWGFKDILVGIEHVIGTDFNDEIIGDDNGNCILGAKGDDLITGAGGDDWLIGNAGNDIIFGGDGNDWLEGGIGIDHLVGGNGRDYFVYSSTDDMSNLIGSETIEDFQPGVDLIILSSIDANLLVEGKQHFAMATTYGGVSTIWIVDNILYGDVNGNGADFSIQISGIGNSLTITDILI